ncbi:MAG: CPBP family glutamic-type intramembrane protease [Akkermansiaceae bacterium]|nr:CPBP family glutamic-type intramembrane protease [Akkermansiaceae bacterium]
MVPSDALKVWLYAAAAVWLGTWTSPLLYNFGKAIAEVCENKQTIGLIEWLAGICRAADFPAFFRAAIWVSAAGLFYPFLKSLSGGWRAWKQGLQKNPNRLRHLAVGFSAVAVGLLFLIATTILIKNHGQPIPVDVLTKLSVGAIFRALVWAALQEIFYQGLVLGIFLRSMPRPAAIALAAAFFALTHFLELSVGVNVLDPDAAGVGFELLGKWFQPFPSPGAWILTWIPLVGLGGILAYARSATRSLALPIGIHGGWIFANHFSMLLAGRSLQQGWSALIGVIYAGYIVFRITRSHHVHLPPSSEV